MPSTHVTFVIATYRRVDALRCTLQSIRLQDHRDWTALVIGDRCGDETCEMIRSLGEPRIRYYNLTERFGEQSGPNSVGLALANGDFVTFLNHDDLLLGDHLSYSLERMAASRADFFIGQAANATDLRFENGAAVPIFTEILPVRKELSRLIVPDPYIFDPSSFWLVRTPFAKKVGSWRQASGLWRTPLRDWVMRAWRLGGKFSFGDRITGLRFWTQNLRAGAPLYSNATPEHDYMIGRFLTETPDEIRRFVQGQLEEAVRPSGRSSVAGHLKKCLRMILAEGYVRLGVDPVVLRDRLLGRPRGMLLNRITRKRTGESLAQGQSIPDLLRNPEGYRVL
jgi:glycosyltransferase involved in cell wall biosynthesis